METKELRRKNSQKRIDKKTQSTNEIKRYQIQNLQWPFKKFRQIYCSLKHKSAVAFWLSSIFRKYSVKTTFSLFKIHLSTVNPFHEIFLCVTKFLLFSTLSSLYLRKNNGFFIISRKDWISSYEFLRTNFCHVSCSRKNKIHYST